MSLTKVIYRQLWQKAALLDSFLTTKRGLIPRRELARFNQYVPSEIYNKTNEELADLAKDENLFRSSLRHIFKDANQSIDDDHPSPMQQLLNETRAKVEQAAALEAEGIEVEQEQIKVTTIQSAEKKSEAKRHRQSTNESLSQEQQEIDLNEMFGALRLLNSRIDQINAKNWLAKPATVKFDIGQIFTHKLHGFQGVIVDWYETCPADENWANSYGPFEDGMSQPFYRCLIDKQDRPPDGFMSLAAQENLIAVGPEVNNPIQHDALQDLGLTDDQVIHGRHVLSDEKKKHYPDD